MQEFNVLSQCGLSIQLFEALSYHSSLPLSLKRTLRHFDKDELLRDVDQALAWYQVEGNGYLEKLETKADYRIKSRSSARFKYLRYYPDRPTNKVFNI